MQLSCAIVLLSAFVQQPVMPPPFIMDNGQRLMNYYKAKDPTLGPKLLAELLQKENIDNAWFTDKEHVLMVIGSQLGDIVAGNPKLVREYEAKFVDAPAAGKRVILRALTNCGDVETIKCVDAWLDDKRCVAVKTQLTALKKHLTNPKRLHFRDQPAKTPDDLDLLWANFFTTGEYAPISRILDVFDQADASETMKRVAKWSLGSNLQQHPKLVEIVLKNEKDRPEGSRTVIGQLIIRRPKSDKP
jgi:hypothetical protein